MLYCNKCKKAIRKTDICPDCGNKGETPENINIPTFLIKSCGFERDRIGAALNDVGIPFMEKPEKKEVGSEVLMGGNASVMDIYVPFSAYKKAHNALVDIGAAQPWEDEDNTPEDIDIKDIKKDEKEGGISRGASVLLMIMVLLLIVGAVFMTDAITAFIKTLF